MAPVSNHTYAESGLPNIYGGTSSAPNTARSGPKESRFDANTNNAANSQRQQVWGARPAPPQHQRGPDAAPARTSSNGSGDGDNGSGFSLPALTPRISAVTLPTSSSAPLVGSSYHDASHQPEPSSAPTPPQPTSSAGTQSVGGFTPSPPRVQSGGRSPNARPTVGNTAAVTPGAAAAFADLENENKMLEEIFEDAKDIIGIEREMKKAGGEYVIQKRMTSTYEIAAHLGVESQALAPTTRGVYTLKDPHSLAKTAASDGPQTPRQVGTAGALAPTNTVMRRLSLAPFLDPNNSPLLSGRRVVSSPTTTPRTPLSSITTSTPRRYDPAGDKSRYAQLFAEQTAMEKQQKESTVQYQSMLETYFKLQEEMKKKMAEDPWEMAAGDFEDQTVMNLKRRLSQLVGIPLDGVDFPAPAEQQQTSQEE